MWAQIAQGVGGYLQKRQAAKSSRAWATYNNAMAGIQAGQARNSISTNVAINRAQHAENKVALEISRMQTAAKVRVGAAAAGVTGGSVANTIFNVGRNAGNKLRKEENRMDMSLLITDQKRRNIAMSVVTNKKTGQSNPSLLGAIGNTSLSILAAQGDKPKSDGTAMEAGQDTSTGFNFGGLKIFN